MSSTVHRAELEGAVLSREAFEALTLSVHTAAPVLAVTGTLGLSTVGSFPARLTNAATGLSAVVSVTVAVRFCSHRTFDKE